MGKAYDFKSVQAKWRPIWEREGLYRTGEDPGRPKFYCLDFFPYPSGSGLSVGHMRNYVPTDVISRMKRMQGFNVLHPMGWDAFGLPAENYAMKMGVAPQRSTADNVANYKRQMALAELSYDWSKEINSTDPDYYRFTQWFFLLLHERGLAYRGQGMQWFCAKCGTVLANEQVVDGKCWRHDSESDPPVQKKPMMQWFFRITAYADRLLADLKTVDWPEHIKKMQENWIGRSVGARLVFKARRPDGTRVDLPVFTTRPDTVYGATYMVIAPEHPLLPELVAPARKAAVAAYVAEAAAKTEIERLAENKSKTGVDTGATALNPFSGEEIPIWAGDYVLATYGTGAIMAVPAHDTRDHAFARTYGLPLRTVIAPAAGAPPAPADQAYTEDGCMVASGPFTGRANRAAIPDLIAYAAEKGWGREEINFKFRDWLISRQRYWGAPIPIVHCRACGEVPVPKDQLPVRLPAMTDFQPSGDGRSPLARVAEWVGTPCPRCRAPAQRETDTMDGFACSSWYFLRFPDPQEASHPFSERSARYWNPVDLYVGGAEHAVMHLLYARFWTKVMHDAGLVPFAEPFQKLRNQGMMLGADGQKMSKSKGNVVTPDEVEASYGADVLRAFILFLGSFETETPWNPDSIKGIAHFLDDVVALVDEHPGRVRPAGAAFAPRGAGAAAELARVRHDTVRRVTQDIEGFSFNTAVSALMELKNALRAGRNDPALVGDEVWSEAIETLLVLLAPIAPFAAEELWERSGRRAARGSVHRQAWPAHDKAYLARSEVELPVQINGKLRDKITVPAGLPEDEVKKLVLASAKVQQWIQGKEIAKFIFVKDRMVSLALRG